MRQLLLLLFFSSFISPVSYGQDLNLDSLYQEGLTSIQSFRFQEALDQFFECQRNDPFNTDYLSQLGYCYLQTGNLPEARTYFLSAIRQDSLHLHSLNYLANIEEQLMLYGPALSRIEQLIAQDSLNGYYYRKAGDLSDRLNDRDQALWFYHHAIRLNPGDQDALTSMCGLLAESGYLLQADSLLESALGKQPGNLRLLYESAKINYRLRMYDETIGRLESALEMGDTNLVYLPLLPFALAQLERCEEAIPWFEYYTSRKEPNEQVYYFLGFCYMKQDSMEKSMDYYLKAIEEGISPNVGVYYQHMGDMMSERKKYRQALAFYETSEEYGNENPEMYFHQAVAFDHLYKKDKKRPLGLYKKYLELDKLNNKDFRKYAEKRVEEIEYYEKHIWKGH